PDWPQWRPTAPLPRAFPAPRHAVTPSSETSMANIKSQIKRNRQNERLRLRNKSVRSEIRTRTKSAVVALNSGADGSDTLLADAVRRIDKAAAQGVIHRNQAANRKSKLMRRARAASGGETGT
ncbi:MAG TPA: 30S ribosomal protein S20, partial [Acidimicrobiales bacterium]|nr:30S ribosomal protein S20 [Acidimicrobiales bacterium]